jgi:hypothetical protein
LEAAEQEIPSPVQAGQRKRGAHTACHAEGIARPIPVATRTWGLMGGPGSAACRDGARTANTAAGEDRSGSWLRRLMDFVVAPYLQLLPLERRAGMIVECTPERNPSVQRVARRTLRWAWPRTRSWRRAGLGLEGIAQQMLNLRQSPQRMAQGRLDRQSSNLCAGTPVDVRP